ncbi:hypothetical protein N2152v2_001118 [Parachlorella kessleri]
MKATIHALDNQHGYIWDAAGFKQQNAVHGLPLQLSADEVTLALERGWAVLLPAPSILSQATSLGSRKRAWRADEGYGDSSDEEEQPAGEAPLWKAALSRSAPFTVPIAIATAVRDAGGEGGEAASPGPILGGSSCSSEAPLPGVHAGLGSSSHPAAAAAPLPAANVPGGDPGVHVRGADYSGDGVANGKDCSAGDATASTAAAAAATAAAAGAADVDAATAAAAAAVGEGVRWRYPSTQEERHRYWVFRDLHQLKYRITGGSKFGADFLVYPGDPTLFHAQFCVRLMPYRSRILPALLAAAARGSHQARKHLLLASVVEGKDEDAELAGAGMPGPSAAAGAAGTAPGPAAASLQPVSAAAAATGNGYVEGQGYKIRYITIGPVEGFG